MKKIISKYGLFTGFGVVLLVFGLFTNIAKAEYYNSYYNYSNTYPYQGNYNNYTYANNYSAYPYYQSSNLDYSSYRQSCPTGFSLGIQNGAYVCFQSLNDNYNNDYYSFNNNQILGCSWGYLYSPITGQRCDYYNNYYYDDYYDNDYSNNNDGDIEDFDVKDGDDTNLEEGDSNKEIIKIRFDVVDGDIRLDKIKFNFEFRGDDYDQYLPWEIFDEMKLLSDGDEVKSIDTDSRNDWDEEDDGVYNLTFDNLNEKIKENDKADLSLEVDINSNIDWIDNSDISWDILIPDKGIRARDENGNTIYIGDDRESVSIEID